MTATEQEYSLVFLLFSLLTGMCVGSFMNVVIYRLPLILYGRCDGERHFSLSWPPSHCPRCQSRIKFYDNVPVLSWLLLRGKCRYCHLAISADYPLTEAVCGLWFAGVYCFLSGLSLSALLTFSGALALLPPVLLFCLLYCITLIDLRHYLIPDVLSLGLLWCGLVFSVTGLTAVSPLQAVAGCVLIWLLVRGVQQGYYLLRRHEGLGGGDAKLYAAAAVWLGAEQLPWLILLSALCGVVCYGGCQFYRRRAVSVTTPLAGSEPPAAGLSEKCVLQTPEMYTAPPAAELSAGGGYVPFGPAIALATLFLYCVRL